MYYKSLLASYPNLLPRATVTFLQLNEHHRWLASVIKEQVKLGNILFNDTTHTPVTVVGSENNSTKDAIFEQAANIIAKEVVVLTLCYVFMKNMDPRARELVFEDPFGVSSGLPLAYPELQYMVNMEEILPACISHQSSFVLSDMESVIDAIMTVIEVLVETANNVIDSLSACRSSLLTVDVNDGDPCCHGVAVYNCGNVYEIRFKLRDIMGELMKG